MMSAATPARKISGSDTLFASSSASGSRLPVTLLVRPRETSDGPEYFIGADRFCTAKPIVRPRIPGSYMVPKSNATPEAETSPMDMFTSLPVAPKENWSVRRPAIERPKARSVAL